MLNKSKFLLAAILCVLPFGSLSADSMKIEDKTIELPSEYKKAESFVVIGENIPYIQMFSSDDGSIELTVTQATKDQLPQEMMDKLNSDYAKENSFKSKIFHLGIDKVKEQKEYLISQGHTVTGDAKTVAHNGKQALKINMEVSTDGWLWGKWKDTSESSITFVQGDKIINIELKIDHTKASGDRVLASDIIGGLIVKY